MADSRADELRRRLERDPDSRLFAQLAEELRKAGELDEAIGVARAGLEKHPTYPSARLTLGRALLDSGDPAAARVEFETAVREAPDNILASRLLGEALETLGDLGSALVQYRTTLGMAPGDKHVESRVRAIQERLGGPGAAPGEGQGAPPEITKPTPAARPGEGATPPPGTPGGGLLPPTIRIRMPGDSAPLPRAPLPPTAPPGAREDRGEAQPTEAELAASELPATLPMPGQESHEDAEEPGDRPAPTESEEEEEILDESDMAPTLPKSRAPEFVALDESLPPTLPPGVITSVESPEEPPASDAPGEAPDQRSGEGGGGLAGAQPPAFEPEELLEAPADQEIVSAEHTPAFVPPPGGDAEPEGATAEKDSGAMPAGPEAVPFAGEGPPAAEPGVPETAPAEPEATPEVKGAGGAEQPPLSSATLAELYFQQGLLERAVEVYRQVLEEEPGHPLARSRLAEIERLVEESAAELPVPAPEGVDERAVRRRALERAIERLEALLAAVRRR